jgi:hypothetical protein
VAPGDYFHYVTTPRSTAYWQPRAYPVRNNLATAAMLCGVFGLCGAVPALFGLVLGIVALAQVVRRGQVGQARAITGILLSTAWLSAFGVLIYIGLHWNVQRSGDGTVTRAGVETTGQLRPGDCVATLPKNQPMLGIRLVPCTQPHVGEVFALFDLPSGAYPGDAAVRDQVGSGCERRLASYSAAAARDKKLGIYYIGPDAASWLNGNRHVVCVAAYSQGRPRTGSFQALR